MHFKTKTTHLCDNLGKNYNSHSKLNMVLTFFVMFKNAFLYEKLINGISSKAYFPVILHSYNKCSFFLYQHVAVKYVCINKIFPVRHILWKIQSLSELKDERMVVVVWNWDNACMNAYKCICRYHECQYAINILKSVIYQFSFLSFFFFFI